MTPTYAMFLTEREAREYINSTFGENAHLAHSTIDSGCTFDIDTVPFTWDGETAAIEVNNGEAYVGYWESAEAAYAIECLGIVETTDSLYAAREVADKMVEVAEECNVTAEVTITDGFGEIIDTLEVSAEEDEESADFYALWKRMTICEAIRKAREAKGLTVRQLGALTGLSKNHIWRLEAGRFNYTIDTLTTVCRVLGLTITIG